MHIFIDKRIIFLLIIAIFTHFQYIGNSISTQDLLKKKDNFSINKIL